MRRTLIGVVLVECLLSWAVLVFGQGLLESEFGDNGGNRFDLDLFTIGSNLRSLGNVVISALVNTITNIYFIVALQFQMDDCHDNFLNGVFLFD